MLAALLRLLGPPNKGTVVDDVPAQGTSGGHTAAIASPSGADSREVGPGTSETMPAAEKRRPGGPCARTALEPARAVHAAASVATAVISPLAPPGICWHRAHVTLDGDRFGVTPHRDAHATASLTRCRHTNPDGL